MDQLPFPGEMVELELITPFWKVKKRNEDNNEDSMNLDDASESSDDGNNPLCKSGMMQSNLKNQEQLDVDNDKVDLTGTKNTGNVRKGKKKYSPKLQWQVWEEEHQKGINEITLEDIKLDDQSDTVNETAEASSDLTMPLLRYQKEWLFWALKQEKSEIRGGILADEMGMGKTIQAIALVLAKRELHRLSSESDESTPSPSPGSSNVLPVIRGTLVICPMAAVTVWVNEIDSFTSKGSTRVLVYYGPKRQKSVEEFSDYDFVITTYPTLVTEFRKDMSLLHSVKWQRIMLDEAHIIKSRNSKTTKAVLALDSTYRWALSGSPFQNSVGELYCLVRFLRIFPYSYYFCLDCNCQNLDWSYPCSSCGHNLYSHFCWWNRYLTKPKQVRRKNAMMLLKRRVLKDILLRRTKSGRAADLQLPPKYVSLRKDWLDKTEEDYYKSLNTETRDKFNKYITEGTLMKNYAHLFALIVRLRQAVCHPYLVEFSETATSRDGNKDNADTVEQVCSNCNVAEDLEVTSCEHIFCKPCLAALVLCAALEEVPCPSCSVPIDFTSNKDLEDHPAKKTTLEGFGPSSILNKIDLENFQTSTKIEALREEIGLMLERDGSAKGIVFSQFPPFLDLIHYSLEKSEISCVQYVGAMTSTARDAAIKKFIEDPDCRIFLMSLKAGGVALNLTVASHVFLMDPWWNPAVERQAQDRVHRIGQHKPIRIVKFITENTIEEMILKFQEKKEVVFEGIIDDDPEAQKKLTEDLTLFFS